MKLKLNLNGSVKPFSNYLKNFAKIRNSILLEIDTMNNMFVAKVATEDKGAVRFSVISFEDCNISVVSGQEPLQTRIKLGIVSKLPKLIKMIDCVGSDTDKDGKSNIKITIDYDEMNTESGIDLVGTKTTLKSKNYEMKLDGHRVGEFKYVSDDSFNNLAFRCEAGCTFELSPESNASIISTSDIFSEDAKKDGLVFTVEENNVYVSNLSPREDASPDFKILISTTEDYCGSDNFRTPVYRCKFMDMLKGTDETYKVKIGYVMSKEGRKDPRILFDSLDSITKIVIAGINEVNG